MFLIQFNRFMWEDIEKGFLEKVKEFNLFLNLKIYLRFIQKTSIKKKRSFFRFFSD